MTTAFKLIAKAVRLQVPPRVVFFGLMNKLNYLFKTHNRRFEFERLYLETFDPWDYHTSPYERAKYALTLERILQFRSAAGLALEIGCSVGVFSGMLADCFDEVVSIDVSGEALRSARQHNTARTNIEFRRSELQRYRGAKKADVIVCAEVLYYVRAEDSQLVCHSLEENLAPDGVIIYVSGVASGPSTPYYYHGWPDVLMSRFEAVHREKAADEERPYELIVFRRRN
jgi:2-polyprenyl-3-methyl-5-hydroxy-6-metoxy-1,4-benzoquinol methylase